jgi:site-specific DNA-methyltransferase (adenine-specific)/adenine-specific DNA-methyltransferase
MAELVWRGKYSTDQQQVPSISACQSPQKHYQCITEYFCMPNATSTSPPPFPTGWAQDPSLPSWCNRLIHGDKNLVLPALTHEFSGKIDLIYIDPPFMTGRTFNKGSQLAYHDVWHNDLDTYLLWLYETLQFLYALLANDGSLYIHLDWRVAHYVKVMLDEIFCSQSMKCGAGFKNEIIWHYQSGGRAVRSYSRKHDTLFLYTKSAQYCFHPERVGQRRGSQKRNHMRKETTPEGHIRWTIRTAGRVYSYDENSMMSLADVWTDISHLHQRDPERKGYATQKPAALLERILLASSEHDDLVLDCFCGSGVTPAVAEQLGRRWIACDKSELAISMTCDRLLSQRRNSPFISQRITEEHGIECI